MTRPSGPEVETATETVGFTTAAAYAKAPVQTVAPNMRADLKNRFEVFFETSFLLLKV